MRTKSHWDYDERMFAELGIIKSFYDNFVRPNILRLNNNKCGKCGTIHDLQIHHDDLKLINVDTLKVFCRSCHRKLHKKKEAEK